MRCGTTRTTDASSSLSNWVTSTKAESTRLATLQAKGTFATRGVGQGDTLYLPLTSVTIPGTSQVAMFTTMQLGSALIHLLSNMRHWIFQTSRWPALGLIIAP